MNDVPDPPAPAALAVSAFFSYAVMTLVGLVLMRWQDIDLRLAVFGDGSTLLIDLGLGAGAGIAIVVATRLLGRWEPMARLDTALRELIGRPGTGVITVLSVTSAVGEEVLFRGALQPLIGFWLTALLFGLLHGGSMPRFRGWVLFAILVGLLLGALAHLTDNLLAPILCHLTVNYFNLHHLARETP